MTRRHDIGPWPARIGFYTALLALWAVVAWIGVWPEAVFPGPGVVVQALIAGIGDGLFVKGVVVSLYRIAIGYGIAVVVGVVLGLFLGRVRVLQDTLGTLVVGLQALPSVCWLPLAVLWFGLNERAIIFVVVMGAVFSITLGVEAGVRNLTPLYLHAARNLGARGIAVYTQVIIPAAQPAIIAGLKQGWSFAWRSLMASELLYYTLSLGNLLQAGRVLNDASQVMAVMVVIVAVGVAIDRAFFAPVERYTRERWGLAA